MNSKRFPVSGRFFFNPLKVYENVIETVGVAPVVLVVLPAHYFDKGDNDGESAADNGNDYGVTHRSPALSTGRAGPRRVPKSQAFRR